MIERGREKERVHTHDMKDFKFYDYFSETWFLCEADICFVYIPFKLSFFASKMKSPIFSTTASQDYRN